MKRVAPRAATTPTTIPIPNSRSPRLMIMRTMLAGVAPKAIRNPDSKGQTDNARNDRVLAVMREGMKGKVGIGKLALYGREYLVAVRPQERGIVMYTLHHAAEIRSIDTVEELNSVATTVKPEEMKLAKQVIATFEGPLDWPTTRTNTARGCSASSKPRSPGKKSSRRRSRHHPGSST